MNPLISVYLYQILLLVILFGSMPARTRLRMIGVGGGEFKATGTITHDDAGDFAGTFTNMLDVYDRLELGYFKDTFEQDAVGINPSKWTTHEHPPTTNVSIVSSPVKYGSRACNFYDANAGADVQIYQTLPSRVTDTEGVIVWYIYCKSGSQSYLRTFIRDGAGAKMAFYFVRIDASNVRWYYYDGATRIIESNLNYNQWYKIEIFYNLDTDKFDAYRDGVLKVNQGNFWNTATGLDYSYWLVPNANQTSGTVIDNYSWYTPSGSYESQTLNMGAGVDWGTFTWTENADGATIVAQVKTSPDGADWSESWQTLNSGDYITGNQQFLKYKFTITNGTEETYIDDIVITYSV
jgi:hypothetical protein